METKDPLCIKPLSNGLFRSGSLVISCPSGFRSGARCLLLSVRVDGPDATLVTIILSGDLVMFRRRYKFSVARYPLPSYPLPPCHQSVSLDIEFYPETCDSAQLTFSVQDHFFKVR